MDIELPVSIRRQPDYTTCGPTSRYRLIGAIYFGASPNDANLLLIRPNTRLAART
jgi:hypothetical protein